MSDYQPDLNIIWNKSDEDKLNQLLDSPENFCADMIYLIDHHLQSDLSTDMRINLTNLKTYIQNEPDGYVAENIALLTLWR